MPSLSRNMTQEHVCFLLDAGVELVSQIGSGTYGEVYIANDLSRNRTCAVKVLSTSGLNLRQLAHQGQEIVHHARVGSHPNVVELYAALESSSHRYLLMEYCPGGDLFWLLTAEREESSAQNNASQTPTQFVLNDKVVRDIFLQLVDAVAHCHSLGVYHRDLKPENVLFGSDGQARLADFGLASSQPWVRDFGVGSSFYMAPEIHEESHPSKPRKDYHAGPADVWSLGVILLNICFARNPWRKAHHADPTFAAYMERGPSILAEVFPMSDGLLYLCSRVFAIDPNERCSLSELKWIVNDRCETFTNHIVLLPKALESPDRSLETGSAILDGKASERCLLSTDITWADLAGRRVKPKQNVVATPEHRHMTRNCGSSQVEPNTFERTDTERFTGVLLPAFSTSGNGSIVSDIDDDDDTICFNFSPARQSCPALDHSFSWDIGGISPLTIDTPNNDASTQRSKRALPKTSSAANNSMDVYDGQTVMRPRPIHVPGCVISVSTTTKHASNTGRDIKYAYPSPPNSDQEHIAARLSACYSGLRITLSTGPSPSPPTPPSTSCSDDDHGDFQKSAFHRYGFE